MAVTLGQQSAQEAVPAVTVQHDEALLQGRLAVALGLAVADGEALGEGHGDGDDSVGGDGDGDGDGDVVNVDGETLGEPVEEGDCGQGSAAAAPNGLAVWKAGAPP